MSIRKRIGRWVSTLAVAGSLVAVWMMTTRAQIATPSQVDVVEGKRLFDLEDWSETGLTCKHCHADFNEKKTPDTYVRVGHPLFNSGFRAGWNRYDGQPISTLEEAIAACAERWITARVDSSYSGVVPQKHRIRKLAAYLQSDELSPEKRSKALELKLAEAVPTDLLLKRGDMVVGSSLFRSRCSICHLSDGTGAAPSLIRNGYSRYLIAKKVRALGARGLKGLMMPGYARDRISERELLNVVAYVYQM